jgi:hypothetical protein
MPVMGSPEPNTQRVPRLADDDHTGTVFDVDVSDPTVQDVVVELRAELRSVVGLDHLDLEGKLLQHVVQEPDCALLVESRFPP